MDEAKNQINDLEYKETKNNQTEKQEGNRIQKNKDSISSLWDNFNRSNICIMWLPEEEKKQEIRHLFAKEDLPNLVKEIDLEVQETQGVPNKMDAKKHQDTS